MRSVVRALLLLAAPAWAQGPAGAEPARCGYTPRSATLTVQMNAACTMSGYPGRWQVDTSPRHGSATVSRDGILRYEPARDFVGGDAFAFALGNPLSAVGGARSDSTWWCSASPSLRRGPRRSRRRAASACARRYV